MQSVWQRSTTSEHGATMPPKDAGTIADASTLAHCFRCSRLAKTLLHLVRTTAMVVMFTSVTAAVPVLAQTAIKDDLDRSIKPGDDFYRYANGAWLGTVAI